MTTRMVHDKIPHNFRARKAQDVAAPGIKAGVQGVIPSILGIAGQARFAGDGNNGATHRAAKNSVGGERFQTRYARVADMLMVTTKGLDALIKIRDSAEAQTDPELAALANDPRVMAAFRKVIEAIGKVADELIEQRWSEMSGKDNQLNVPGMDAALGSIHNPLILDARRIELTRKRAAEMLGAINPERVRQGLPDEPATSYDILKSSK